jgi:hypothetical protein
VSGSIPAPAATIDVGLAFLILSQPNIYLIYSINDAVKQIARRFSLDLTTDREITAAPRAVVLARNDAVEMSRG